MPEGATSGVSLGLFGASSDPQSEPDPREAPNLYKSPRFQYLESFKDETGQGSQW